MRPTITYARIALFILGVNALGMAAVPVADPPWNGPLFVFLVDGQILLLVLWAALGAAPWYYRWPWLSGVAYLLWRPWPVANEWNEFWRHATLTMILPHALTVLTLSCLLRAARYIIVTDATAPEASTPRQFNLRTMFAWTAGVAVLLSAWKQFVTVQIDLHQFFGELYGQAPAGLIWVLLMRALVDLALATMILQTPSFTSRLKWLWYCVCTAATTVLISGLWPALDLTLLTAALDSMRPFYRCAELYLLPVVAGLLLARAAGYRLAWADGALDRISQRPVAKRSGNEDVDMRTTD